MFEVLLMMVMVIGVPAIFILFAYKVACGYLSEVQSKAQSAREDAELERQEAEGDALRLRMLREKMERRQPANRPALAPEKPDPPFSLDLEERGCNPPTKS